ncbi:MAG TPA: lipoyl synthase [Elusimicrobiota bacterium]|nr:lipoyl synthase [Elusimicrobiota bacterium]
MNAVRRPLPREYRREIPSGPQFRQVNDILGGQALHTICHSGKCPNRGECFSRGSLAFMILGDVCTRHCGFCAVKAGNPGGQVDWSEPRRLARAAAGLRLRHVVVTSVARDDLADGGASVFAECIRELRIQAPEAVVEVLTPDYNGDWKAIDIVLDAQPDIFNHNMETVERLTPRVRSRATYRRSLEVLDYIAQNRRSAAMKCKSGFMLGLGETPEEVRDLMHDLRAVSCDYLTIGQYLQPSAKHLPIQSFVPMDEFRRLEREARAMGFERVASGPLVRSSYFADRLHTPPSPATGQLARTDHERIFE